MTLSELCFASSKCCTHNETSTSRLESVSISQFYRSWWILAQRSELAVAYSFSPVP